MTIEERLEKLEREFARSERIDLVDAEGGMRAMLAVGEGGPVLLLFDLPQNDGRLLPRAWLGVTKDGPRLSLFDKKPCVTLVVDKDGPGLILSDEKGETRVGLGEPRAVLTAGRFGAFLDVAMTMDMDKMRLELHDAAGKLQAQPLHMDDARRINMDLRDAEGKVRVVLTVGAANQLDFLLHDAEGQMRASLAMGNDWCRLRLCDAVGKTRAVLDVDKDGPGLSLQDEKGKTIWSAP